MDTTPRRPSPSPANGFVSVDDGGDFTFHESAAAVVAEFEYPFEAACILDRNGAGFRLALDAGRRLALVRDAGEPDFAWLRQAWAAAERRNPRRYPLRRFYPQDSPALLEAVFECLYLRHGPDPWPGLSAPAVAEGGVVVDPFGHTYRRARLPAFTKAGGRNPMRKSIYVEIDAASAPGFVPPPRWGQPSDPGRPTVTGTPAPGVGGS